MVTSFNSGNFLCLFQQCSPYLQFPCWKCVQIGVLALVVLVLGMVGAVGVVGVTVLGVVGTLVVVVVGDAVAGIVPVLGMVLTSVDSILS